MRPDASGVPRHDGEGLVNSGHAEPPAPQHGVDSQRARIRRFWIVLIAFVVIGIAGSTISPTIRHQWALSLIRQPTRYTLLYFDHPASLPNEVTEGQSISFSFTIGNEQGRSVIYRYDIGVTPANDPQSQLHSMTVLANGAMRSIPVKLRPLCMSTPCQIRVSLPAHHQSIHFIVKFNGTTKEPGG